MITIDDFKANTKEWLIDKLESLSQEEALQTISNLYDELHKSKYPKTYEECCKNYPDNEKLNIGNLLCDLEQLITCRNAYWKIAGKQMGLSEPWEPDWKIGEQKKYCISYSAGIIQKCTWCNYNSILAFPTEEMRDAFYENFKDLIKQCKELL